MISKAQSLAVIITNNWKAKIGALIVAVIFFYYVQYTRNVTRVVYVRVDPPSVPEMLIVNSRIPSFTKVEFFGPQEAMDFNPSNFKIILENPGPGPGENRYRLDLLPKPPDGIEAHYNDGITITLDRISERKLPVVADLQYNSSTDRKLGLVTFSPETIRVVGPASIISSMDRVSLNPIKVSVAGNDVTVYSSRVLVATLPEFVKLANDQPYEVDVLARLVSPLENPDQSGYYSRELQVSCDNAIPGLKLDEPSSVTVLFRSANQITDGRLSAKVFCPVYLDANTRNILPSFRISAIPVNIRDNLMQSDIEIVSIEPSNVNLQFSLVKMRPPTQVQKGMEEHLIR
ncbi:MAG: hypothetical protein H3C43_02335 [Leptonema sp. (in: Bacteria)]|nr:hypothetical protein [Leptonema sp. (in: bacteria)]